MNKRTIGILLIALVLVVLLLLVEKPFRDQPPGIQPSETPVQLFARLNEEDCSRIEISGQLVKPATVVRKGRDWFTADGHKADVQQIQSLFTALQDMNDKPELVSINPDSLIKFQVDPVTGIRLTMYDMEGKSAVDLMVGKLDGDFYHTPVRKPDSNNVYRLGGGRFAGQLRYLVTPRTWRDPNVLRVEPDQIVRAAVASPSESYSIMREDTSSPWHFLEPTSAPVNADAVGIWVRGLVNLRSGGFEDTTGTDILTTFGLANATSRMSVQLDNGTSYTVLFGRRTDTDLPTTPPARMPAEYYVKRADDPQIYRLSQQFYNNIFKKSDDLKPKPQLTPTPAALSPLLLPTPTTTTATAIRPTTAPMPPSSPPRPPQPARQGDAVSTPSMDAQPKAVDKPTTGSSAGR